MAYVCEVGKGRKLHLENRAGQTMIMISSTAPGQQQQASSSFQTGPWSTIPEVYLTVDGAVVKLQTANGGHYIRIQGNSIGVSEALSLDALQQMQMQQVAGNTGTPPMEPMQPMQPMEPMQPMTMGNMSMNANSMEMRMGDMAMQMGDAANPPAAVHRFCSQCGTAVKPEDRFCTSCGHRLGS